MPDFQWTNGIKAMRQREVMALVGEQQGQCTDNDENPMRQQAETVDQLGFSIGVLQQVKNK
jgi:hypothetical protein